MPTPVTPEEIVRAWFDRVWNQRDESAIDEFLSTSALVHGLGNETMNGPDGFRPFAHALRAALPNIHIAVGHVICEGDNCAAYCTVTGTHSGEGLAPDTAGRKVIFTGMVMIHVKHGQIVEAWNSFDFLSFYQQLGVVPQLP